MIQKKDNMDSLMTQKLSSNDSVIISQDLPMELHTWAEWFENAGRLVPDLKAYEDLLLKYYKLQCTKSEDGQACVYQKYLQAHPIQFYERNIIVPGWLQRKCTVIGVIIGLVTGIIMWLVGHFLRSGNTGTAGLDTMALAIGPLVGIISMIIPELIHHYKVKRLWKRFCILEDKLKEPLSFIPPRYRNSQSCQAFYDCFCSYQITTFDEAIRQCDAYLQDGNLNGLYLSVLSDVSFNRSLLDNENGQGVYLGDRKDTSFDENLPDDIEDHVFSGVDDAEKRLNNLVGLEKVKQQVSQMKNRMAFDSKAKNTGNHMIFLGPPGTGKTTIARIITKILYDNHYIEENRLIEIDGGYLKSGMVGHTAERVSAIMKYALGGVLFIDEAYVLNEGTGEAGREATGVLLKYMEDHRSDFVVILAGYEDNMNRMLATNEGFSSRIKHKIYFDNFTTSEMLTIFRMFLKQGHDGSYKIEKSALNLLERHFEKERMSPAFGNARVIRNTWEKLQDIHADRFMRGLLDESYKLIITKEDVALFVEQRKEELQEDSRNFIARQGLDSTVCSLEELKGRTKSGSEHPDEDLANLTGLSVVKDEIKKMKAQFEFYNGEIESEGHHMVFLGPPGTGKTTVASIMTGYLYQLGIISQNAYLDVNGDFLRGMYVGHTGKRTEAVVQYAQGMVLFVDEAYLLSTSGDQNSFGQEAIGVLLDAMEKYRKNFVVIFAGYEKEMKDFLNMNSGLQSRINLEFHFTSYTPHELATMMQRIAKSQRFKVDKNVWKPLQLYLQTQVNDPHFGNGRFIRAFFESAKKAHIMRFANGEYDVASKFLITLNDVQDAIDENNSKGFLG